MNISKYFDTWMTINAIKANLNANLSYIITFFKNRLIPVTFSLIFVFFKETSQFLQQIYVKNVHPVYSAGIWTQHLQSPPINTRLGLPPLYNRIIPFCLNVSKNLLKENGLKLPFFSKMNEGYNLATVALSCLFRIFQD